MTTLQLELYVVGQSVRSLTAITNLKRILAASRLEGRYRLTIVDVLDQPETIGEQAHRFFRQSHLQRGLGGEKPAAGGRRGDRLLGEGQVCFGRRILCARGGATRPDTTPQIQLPRCAHHGSRGDAFLEPALGIVSQFNASSQQRPELRTGKPGLGCGTLDASGRDAQIDVVGDRFRDQGRQLGIAE